MQPPTVSRMFLMFGISRIHPQPFQHVVACRQRRGRCVKRREKSSTDVLVGLVGAFRPHGPNSYEASPPAHASAPPATMHARVGFGKFGSCISPLINRILYGLLLGRAVSSRLLTACSPLRRTTGQPHRRISFLLAATPASSHFSLVDLIVLFCFVLLSHVLLF